MLIQKVKHDRSHLHALRPSFSAYANHIQLICLYAGGRVLLLFFLQGWQTFNMVIHLNLGVCCGRISSIPLPSHSVCSWLSRVTYRAACEYTAYILGILWAYICSVETNLGRGRHPTCWCKPSASDATGINNDMDLETYVISVVV